MDKIAQSLAEQLPSQIDESLQERKNKFERLGVVSLSVFGTIVASFLIYLLSVIIYKKILIEGDVLQGIAIIGVIVCVICGLLSVYLFARANELEAATKRQIQPTEEIAQGNTTAKLLPEPGFTIESVTDRTTEFLFVENGEKKPDAITGKSNQ